MCAGCVMAAAAGASGVRSWLAARHLTWLTPVRMKRATIALFVAAFGFSSVTLGGSSAVGRAGGSRHDHLHAAAGSSAAAHRR